jgi:AcrR family transcriptional regulator
VDPAAARPATVPQRRGGRRPGDSGTRDAVAAAARRQFAELGYDRTTMRSVAAEAGVDQKLVGYFFGSKQRLFVAVTTLPFDAADVVPAILGGDPATAGERLARFITGMLEDPGARSRLVGLIRAAAAEPEAARMARDLVTRELWARAAGLLPADQPELRIGLIASQVIGLIMARYIIGAEPLASLPPEAVAAAIAPILQRHLSGPTPGTALRQP